MSKCKAILLAAALCVGAAYGAMDDKDYTFSATNGVTKTNTYTLRGVLHGVYVDVPAGTQTGTVTVATEHETLFTRAITADGMYRPRVSTHTTAGAAATFNSYSHTGTVANAQTWYDKAAMAGPVSVTLAVEGPGTNWTVTLLYDK